MAAIHAFIKTGYLDKKGEAPVLIEYSHLKSRWRINPRIKVRPASITCEFDNDTELYKLSIVGRLSREEKAKITESNKKLQKLQLELVRIIGDLKLRSCSLSPSNIEREFKRDHKTQIRQNQNSVIEWYQEFITTKEKEIGEGINSYRSTFEHFKTFTGNLGAIQLNDINKAFLEKFRDHLEALKLGGPTIHKQFKNFRIFLNWVETQDEEDQIRIPSAYKKIKVKARYGDPVGLTVEQFLEFCKLDLANRKFLERTRDVFAFAVSIGGPRHGDLKRLADNLRKNGFSINQNTISYFEGKTGNSHQEIQLNRIGLEILHKYNLVLPEVPTNQRMNANLKAIAKLLKWNEIKYIPKYDDFGKLVTVEERPLHDIFSTKFMRKTAATIDNHLGVPIKTSMKRTGHKTFAAFSRYVDVNKESLLDANQKWNKIHNGIKNNRIKVQDQEIRTVA